ncbi:hypothetical protein QDY65_00175 [Pyrococcus kukulkanii]|uniref:hypothetical protein n=1 Tax=Pyrococcus kukulkanii TaxID=1609559 RepID=UPI00356190C3
MKGQLSVDILFAVMLVTITVVSIINLGTQEVRGAKIMDVSSKLRVFSIDIRDTVMKLYSLGPGFKVRKESPFPLEGNDYILVIINSTSSEVQVKAHIEGSTYYTVQRLQIPIKSTTFANLTAENSEFWIVSTVTGGATDVKVSTDGS